MTLLKSEVEAKRQAYVQAYARRELEKEDIPEFRKLLKAFDMGDVHVDQALDSKEKSKNKKKFIEPDDEEIEEEMLVTKELNVNILKVTDPYRHEVMGVVLEPWTKDLQNDIIIPIEIKKASDNYMMNFQKLRAHHKTDVAKAYILQNFIAPCDFHMEGQLVLKDSWVLITKILDEDIWQQVVNKQITGYSIGGRGNRDDLYKEILDSLDDYETIKKSETTKIELEVIDKNNTLSNILKYLAFNGNIGHTLSIIGDPDDERETHFSWDGDGSDKIISIKINGKIQKSNSCHNPAGEGGGQFCEGGGSESGAGGSYTPVKTTISGKEEHSKHLEAKYKEKTDKLDTFLRNNPPHIVETLPKEKQAALEAEFNTLREEAKAAYVEHSNARNEIERAKVDAWATKWGADKYKGPITPETGEPKGWETKPKKVVEVSDVKHETLRSEPDRDGKTFEYKQRYMTASDGKNTIKIVGSNKNEYNIYRVKGDKITGPDAILQTLLTGLPKKDVDEATKNIFRSGNFEPGPHQAKNIPGHIDKR